MSTPPNLPAIAVVVDAHAKGGFQHIPEGISLLNTPGLAVISWPSAVSSEVSDLLYSQGLLVPGIRAVQGPYDPRHYAEVSVAREAFAEEKHLAVAEICDLLGATSVEIEHIEIDTDEGIDRIEISGTTPAGLKAQASINKKIASQLEGRFDLRDRYRPHKADAKAANQLLEEKRLRGDRKLVSLVDSRVRGNLNERSLTVMVSHNSTSSIQAAAQIKVPGYVDFNAEYISEIKKRVEYRITYKFSFE
jgi:hypothetical protein